VVIFQIIASLCVLPLQPKAKERGKGKKEKKKKGDQPPWNSTHHGGGGGGGGRDFPMLVHSRLIVSFRSPLKEEKEEGEEKKEEEKGTCD